MSKEITIEIKNRWTGSILFAYSSVNNTLSKTVMEALKSDADLRGADLSGANLQSADLSGANLYSANLYGANLHCANLYGANLYGANLHSTNLSGANLREANLYEANLYEANLYEVNLRGANLHNIHGGYLACPSDGGFIGWKKASELVVKLRIPVDARRSSAGGDKCRCDKAYVLEIQNMDGSKADSQTVRSDFDENFIYTAGEMVEVPDFNDDRWDECASGIHFFIDRRAAVEY